MPDTAQLQTLLKQITARFNECKDSISSLRDIISDDISQKTLNEILTHEYQSTFQTKYSELCNIYSYITELLIDIRHLKSASGQLNQPKLIQVFVQQAHGVETDVNTLRESLAVLKSSYDARLRYLSNVSFLRSSII